MSDVIAPAVPVSARDQFRRLAVLIATCFVDMIGFAMVLPILPFYALDLKASPFEIGVITAAFSAAQILSAPLWGRVSDRYGRRPALLIGLLGSAIAYVVFGLAHSLWLLFLSRLIQGAGGGTTGVANAYIADSVEPADRARALGWLSAATSAGVMFGPVIGSVAAHGGRAMPGFVAAGLCILNFAFAWKLLPESHVNRGKTIVRKPVWESAWQVIGRPTLPVSRLIWIYSARMLALASLTTVFALVLVAHFSVNATVIGPWFLSSGGLSVVMRTIFLGPIVDRIGETWAMRAGALLLIIGLLLYPIATSIPLLVLIMPLVPIGTALLFPSTTALMTRGADREETGTVMGVAQTFGGVSRVLAPLMATAAFEVNIWFPFVLGAAVVLIAMLMAFRIPVVPPRRKAAPA